MSADLIALRNRLERIHAACFSLGPKQAVGEMVEAMLDMPEWARVTAALYAIANDARCPHGVTLRVRCESCKTEQVDRSANLHGKGVDEMADLQVRPRRGHLGSTAWGEVDDGPDSLETGDDDADDFLAIAPEKPHHAR